MKEIPPCSPTSRTDLRLSSILGSPPPPPSNDLETNNKISSTKLVTSMKQIIRSPSLTETSVSIEPQQGGLLGLDLDTCDSVFHPLFHVSH